MRCPRELPVLWQSGEGLSLPVCTHFYRSDILTSQETKPGFNLQAEGLERRLKRWQGDHHMKCSSETTSRHCLQGQRAVCRYKYGIVRSLADKSHGLIISAVISAWWIPWLTGRLSDFTYWITEKSYISTAPTSLKKHYYPFCRCKSKHFQAQFNNYLSQLKHAVMTKSSSQISRQVTQQDVLGFIRWISVKAFTWFWSMWWPRDHLKTEQTWFGFVFFFTLQYMLFLLNVVFLWSPFRYACYGEIHSVLFIYHMHF